MGGAIADTTGGASTYIPRYTDGDSLLGSANLKFATDDGNYLTIDSGSSTSDAANIFLRVPANSTANPALRWV